MCRSSVLIVVADSTAHRVARRGDGCCVFIVIALERYEKNSVNTFTQYSWSTTLPVSLQLCIARIALPISTPRSGIDDARMLPKVLPPATSLWFTERWHGTPAFSHNPAKTAAETASDAYFCAALNLITGPPAKHWVVRQVVLLRVVRVPSVSIVCRNHKGTFNGLIVRFLCMTL